MLNNYILDMETLKNGDKVLENGDKKVLDLLFDLMCILEVRLAEDLDDVHSDEAYDYKRTVDLLHDKGYKFSSNMSIIDKI